MRSLEEVVQNYALEIVIESDCQLPLISYVVLWKNMTSLGAIDCNFSFCPCSANMAAHVLVNLGIQFSMEVVWFDNVLHKVLYFSLNSVVERRFFFKKKKNTCKKEIWQFATIIWVL